MCNACWFESKIRLMAIFDVTLYRVDSEVFVLQVSSNPNRSHQKQTGATHIKQES